MTDTGPARVRITWARSCEYVATVTTAELRELAARLPSGGPRGAALRILDTLDSRAGDDIKEHQARELGHILSNTEAGREWLGGMADDDPDLLGGTGAPEVTEIGPAPA